MKTTHSDKALTTLQLMNTAGSDWQHPEVKWVQEQHLITSREICPDCRGWRYTGGYQNVGGEQRWVKTDCERCAGSRGRAGTCMVTELRKVLVGYIQWPAGTRFGTSRFGCSGSSAHQCELCAKGINKSGRVPLVTVKDGLPRAMWVGQDCARKFTGVVPVKPEENKKKLGTVLKDNLEAAL